jgi:outer membrane protein assembly factor BamB
MKKIFTAFLFFSLFSLQLFPQGFKFAWITDTHVGSAGGAENLSKVVADINKKQYSFVIVSGDIAEKGRNSELEEAKGILDSIGIKYYVIPGNHDTKWSESGCTKFTELWGGDKFNFGVNGYRFIGLNSGVLLRGGGGHITPEDLVWLDNALKSAISYEKIILITHHPLDGDIDNWYEVTNRLKHYNAALLLYGHGHVNKVSTIEGLPALMGRSSLTNNRGWGYNSIDITKDTLTFFEENGDTLIDNLGSIALNSKNVIPQVDSLPFINYGVKVVSSIDLKKTVSASLLVNGENIYAAAYDGTIYCYDQQGSMKWSYSANGNIVSKPVIINNILVAGTLKGDVVSLDCETGKLLQTLGIDEPVTAQLVAERMVKETDTIDVVFAGTSSGALHCFELNSLEEVWKNTDAKGMIETEPLIVGDKIIYGAWDGYLYCVEISTGRIFWKQSGNTNFYFSPAACKPVTDGKSVFVTSPDKYVSSIDLLLGKANWRKKDANCWESIGISKDKKDLFIKSDNGKIYVIASKTGKVVKSIEYGSGTDTMPIELIESDGNIIFSSKDGKVFLITKNYKLQELLFLGVSRVHSVRKISENVFAASNMDGKIVIFNLADESN